MRTSFLLLPNSSVFTANISLPSERQYIFEAEAYIDKYFERVRECMWKTRQVSRVFKEAYRDHTATHEVHLIQLQGGLLYGTYSPHQALTADILQNQNRKRCGLFIVLFLFRVTACATVADWFSDSLSRPLSLCSSLQTSRGTTHCTDRKNVLLPTFSSATWKCFHHQT